MLPLVIQFLSTIQHLCFGTFFNGILETLYSFLQQICNCSHRVITLSLSLSHFVSCQFYSSSCPLLAKVLGAFSMIQLCVYFVQAVLLEGLYILLQYMHS